MLFYYGCNVEKIFHMKNTVLFALALFFILKVNAGDKSIASQERALWVNTLVRIVEPVLSNLADGTLKKNMPQEASAKGCLKYSHLEAVGRVICGIAPWLELGEENTEEGKLRGKYIDLAVKGLSNAVNPLSSDYLDFATPSQPLVDAAFLAQGLLRAPNQLWKRLDEITKQRVITELKRTRRIKPGQSNWLLFASMVEATLLELTGECDMKRMLYGVETFRDKWYMGDGVYGDGPYYHADYYNSFVIQPMLTDVVTIMNKHKIGESEFYIKQIKRISRYAEQLERMISPEGTYPVIGRSIVYRTGVFHALGQVALMHNLPEVVKPAQVRCALSAVIKKQFSALDTFDEKGWLRIGFVGSQIKMSEYYINTGSSYLCTTGFLALGLPETDMFWSESFTPWTCLKAWSGQDVKADHAIR